MKKFYFLLLMACIVMAITSCSTDYTNNVSKEIRDYRIDNFERSYIQGLYPNTRANIGANIQLIGYTTILLNTEECSYLKRIIQEDFQMKESYCVLDSSLRIYYPLRDAIILYEDNKYYGANHSGIIKIPDMSNMYKIKLAGRKKTEKSVETQLYSYLQPDTIYQDSRCIIYDLGIRYRNCEENAKTVVLATPEEQGAQRVTCINNHLPSRNCTEAFPVVATGHCTLLYSTCMDFNGPLGDCSSTTRTKINFPGSDCFYALALGHCWNEVGMKSFLTLSEDSEDEGGEDGEGDEGGE